MSDAQDHVWRLATGDERPFFEYRYDQMLAVAEASLDDALTLFGLLAEANIRLRKNPGSRSIEVTRLVAPRLQELVARPFPEEPDAVPGVGAFGDSYEWPQVGVLRQLGYQVGGRDPGTSTRRKILRRVFEGPIPAVYSPEYMTSWGMDRSVARLQKMAWSIATFAINRLRALGGEPDEACRTWSEDLGWLRSEFYEGHFGSPWPEIWR